MMGNSGYSCEGAIENSRCVARKMGFKNILIEGPGISYLDSPHKKPGAILLYSPDKYRS